METLWQNLRYAIRMLRKSPGFTAVAVLTLALGIGANAAIFSVVDAILIRPLPFNEANRLVMVWRTNGHEKRPGGTDSYPNFLDWRTQSHTFAAMAAFHSGVDFTLTGAGDPVRLDGAVVSASLFDVLETKPLLGRPFLPDEDRINTNGPPPVILSHRLWEERFHSDEQILDRTLSLNNQSYTVIGIMPNGFQFPLVDHTDLWTTMAFDLASPAKLPGNAQSRSWRYLYVVARLKPQETVNHAQAEMDAITSRLAQEYPGSNRDRFAWIQPLQQSVVGDVRPVLLLLLGAVGLVLLIACVNVASLLLARTTNRRREIAVRASLGASRARLFGQISIESFLLAFLGGSLGLLTTILGTGILERLVAAITPRSVPLGVDYHLLAFSLLLSIVTAVIFGLAPALAASGADPMDALKEGFHGLSQGRRSGRFLDILTAGQIALTLILLTGAGLMIQSLIHLENVDPGFDARHVLTFKLDLPEARYSGLQQAAFHQRLVDQLSTVPGVVSASSVNLPPFGNLEWSGRFGIPEEPGTQGSGVYSVVTPNFFKTLNIPLLGGRDFTSADSAQSHQVVVISKAVAQQYFTGRNPIGDHIFLVNDGVAWEIIGIAGDVKGAGLAREASPEVYIPEAQFPFSFMTVMVRTASNPGAMVSAIRQVVQSMDKDLPIYDVAALDTTVEDSILVRKLNTAALTVFGAIAALLTALGIYGVISYSVARRQHEMGIRMALGARQTALLRLVVGRGLRLALAGIAIGLVGATVLTRFMQSMIFGVRPSDPLSFLAASALLTAVAVVASYIPARRAARIDPTIALRHE